MCAIVWDAENRLIEIATRIDLGGYFGGYDEGDKRLRFVYDHMGRRVRKTAESYNGSSWDVDAHLYFVYVPLRWNVLLVLDAADGSDQGTEPDYKILRKYTWGLDMSGRHAWTQRMDSSGRSCLTPSSVGILSGRAPV